MHTTIEKVNSLAQSTDHCLCSTITILQPLHRTTYVSQHSQLSINGRILLEQSFSAHMSLLAASHCLFSMLKILTTFEGQHMELSCWEYHSIPHRHI